MGFGIDRSNKTPVNFAKHCAICGKRHTRRELALRVPRCGKCNHSLYNFGRNGLRPYQVVLEVDAESVEQIWEAFTRRGYSVSDVTDPRVRPLFSKLVKGKEYNRIECCDLGQQD